MSIQITREIFADVIKQGATKAIYAKQNDRNSRFLNIRIQEDGKNIVVETGVQVKLNVKRSDKATKTFDGTVNTNGSVKVPMDPWMLELAGTLTCDVSIIEEDAVLTTMQFNIYVEEATITAEE